MNHHLHLFKRALLGLMLLGVALTAGAYDFESDGIYYKFNSDSASVMVTYKGSTATEMKSYYGDVVIPSSVTNDDITYPVTMIGEGSFRNCDSLTTVTLPTTIIEIQNSAFDGCKALTSINLPEGLLRMGYNVFLHAESLRSINIPESITNIGSACFSYTAIESIYIPRNATSVGYLGIALNNLTSIVVDSENPNYYSGGGNALVSKSNNRLMSGCSTTVIPETVVTIGSTAFNRCGTLTSIAIPDAVKTIEDNAFINCTNLTEVQITPNCVLYSIGSNSFQNCSSLLSIFLPMTTRYIRSGYVSATFKGCKSLTSIVVDPKNPYLDSRNDCNAIIDSETNELLVGGNLTVIPDDVVGIKDYTFTNCTGLTSVRIPDRVTYIGEYAFQGCSGITDLYIGKSVKLIDDGAFNSCTSLTRVDLPNSLITLNDYAFSYCTALRELSFGTSLVTIGDGAFNACSALTEVVMPKSLQRINRSSFSGTTQMNSITCLALTPPSCNYDHYIFSTASTATLYVPEESLEAYQQATLWKRFKTIVGINPRFEEDGIAYEQIASKGAEVTYKDEGNYAGTLTIPETVEHNDRTFDIVAIGENAFNGDTELERVILPPGIFSINHAAFQGCSALKFINFEEDLDSIAALAFDGCNALDTIICKPLVPPVIASKDCFTMTAYDNATLRVPNESLNDYYDHARWSEFLKIVRMESIETGDINGDYTTDINDVSVFIDYLLGNYDGPVNTANLDINYDGEVDINDLSALIDFLLNGYL